jgi:hypothetical protein
VKLNRSKQPVVYRRMAIPRSEFEARLDRERKSDERFKATLSFLLVLMICVVAVVVAR